MQNITQEPAAGALRVEVIGHQWWWEFRYPDAPAEGGQRGVVTAGELHVPVGRPVRLAISSTDVIHSYWVPQLGGKTDAIPGHVNHQNLLAGLPGEYAGQCAEFCGEQHALMRFSVVAQAPGEFETWLAGQQRRPLTDTLSGPARQGQDLFLGLAQTASGETTPCLGCHTIRGTRAVGVLGPDLTHIGSRRTIVAGTLANTPENMALWLRDPQAVKPGNDMVYTTAFSAEEIRALAAFLESLK
jgi:cytochrome c oxidase subunit 2